MGREAQSVCFWRGMTGEVRALLESHELILRGEIRERIPRSSIEKIAVIDDALVLQIEGKRMLLKLGSAEAERWAIFLRKSPPTLRDKLGISGDKKAWMLGATESAELRDAIQGCVADQIVDAGMVIAIVLEESDLCDAVALAREIPHLPIWFVYVKGKSTRLGDAAIRSHMREHGYIDSKSCRVSDILTATRYAQKKRA